ncbi:hypothetical protein [Coprococcus comes]|uniref:hypothetical protein n=1 Tax=Coprococcus comes TaxID=410072 RepID=UPI001899B8C1|nr:hypothetical protein [Coprococcus comes]
MGEKDENCRHVLITSNGLVRRMLIVDDLIHDLSEKLVDDAEITTHMNNDGGLDITFDFDESLVRSIFAWKLLFGSNNWRKLHGFNMRRKKCLR